MVSWLQWSLSYWTEKRGSGSTSFIITSFGSYLTLLNIISRLCASLFTRSVTESHNLCRLFVVIHLWSTPQVKRRFDTVKLLLLIAFTLQDNYSLVVEPQWSEWLVSLTNIASESDHRNFGGWVGSSNCYSPTKKKKLKRKHSSAIHSP